MNLTDEESVHLSTWPQTDGKAVNEKLEKQMQRAMDIVSKAHSKRKEKGIKVRQPLPKLEYPGTKLPAEIEKIIADEMNVKKIINGKSLKLNTQITPQLRAEGEARELIRMIQQARKEAGCKLDQKIEVVLPNWPRGHEAYIKKETLATKLTKGPKLTIVKS